MNTLVTPTFNMPETEDLFQVCNTKNHSPLEWFNAIEVSRELALKSNIDPDAFVNILRNIQSPEQLMLILELFNEHYKEYPYGDNAYNVLIAHNEESSFKLSDWLDAIEYFYHWLVANNRHATLKSMLSYISGCTDTQPPHLSNLKQNVIDALDTYGFQN